MAKLTSVLERCVAEAINRAEIAWCKNHPDMSLADMPCDLKARAAILAYEQHRGKQEPVGWLYELGTKTTYEDGPERPTAFVNIKNVRPVYAAPTASTGVEARNSVIEEVAAHLLATAQSVDDSAVKVRAGDTEYGVGLSRRARCLRMAASLVGALRQTPLPGRSPNHAYREEHAARIESDLQRDQSLGIGAERDSNRRASSSVATGSVRHRP